MTRIFHYSIYSLVALASLMLTFAEENAFPTGFTVPIAILALYLNEMRRSVRINTLMANLLGLGSFAIAGSELLIAGLGDQVIAAEGRVLAGAHLLSYLTWVALFQDKAGRQYWWLMALSVMQVAVGAILTQESAFGALMLLYVFMALWTLSVFSLYQARHSFEAAGRASWDLALSDVSIAPSRPRVKSPSPALAHHQSDECRGSIQLDPNERWINGRFVMGGVATAIMSLGMGMIFFALIPRLWVGQEYKFTSEVDSPSRTFTGFTDEVQLGEIGQILESNKPVLQVRCFLIRTNEEVDVDKAAFQLGMEDPLFRGSVMCTYESGRWHVLEESRKAIPLAPPNRDNRYLRQQYILHDPASGTLFGMHPVRAASIEDGLIRPAIDLATSILVNDKGEGSSGSREYVLYSSIGRNRYERPRLHEPGGVEGFAVRGGIAQKFLKLPDQLPALSRLAQEIAASVSPFEASEQRLDMRIAEAIEAHLRDSGRYSYSLRADIVDPSIDPVEDFIVNRQAGHCEYFASAMALMLRAADIPSRLVSGFKGGERNAYSGALVVEERHAHAWVEAKVGGRWLTFDPTPAGAREESVREIGSEKNLLASVNSLMSGLWHQRIVRLSIEEQQQAIYGPIGETIRAFLQVLKTMFEGSGEGVSEFLSNPRRWFSPFGFVVTSVFLLLIFVLRSAWKRCKSYDQTMFQALTSVVRHLINSMCGRREAEYVEFYRRFASILARHGFRRDVAQTPLEFSEISAVSLSRQLQANGLTEFPDNLTRLFYRVRYGEHALDDREISSIDELLTRLDAALRDAKTRTK